ncbi:receptor-type tyrosine-protein phosphatase H-like [Argopecten irradians]|uniref:receptor-type tyrosine-protein phosphatase H-like n=1 Tax=Argopecten irradians TaxID=31199 RepID=UPI003722D9CF
MTIAFPQQLLQLTGLVVTSLSVGVEGTSTVTITWNAPSPGVDQVSRYQIHWTPVLSNGTSSYTSAKATSVRLTGFVSGQMYNFSVKSVEDGSRQSPQEVQTSVVSITVDAGLGVGCDTDGSIKCSDTNAECTQTNDMLSTVCRCKASFFDSNGYDNTGGMCVAMSTLMVGGITFENKGSDSVNISWTPPAEYTDQVTRYEVSSVPPEIINGYTEYSAQLLTVVHLEGFTPGQTYTFSVSSVESGSRTQEQMTSITSSPITMKPVKPTSVLTADVDGPVIMISWTRPNGVKTSYDVFTTPSLSPTTTSTESITYSTGVIDGQRYNISITTVSGSERSDPLVATFRTVSKTPDPPTSLTCQTTTDKSITLSWIPPSLPRGDIQYYVVNSYSTGDMYTTTSSLTVFTVNSGLQPASYYAFSVATVNDAVTENNRSSFSSVLGCYTKSASK